MPQIAYALQLHPSNFNCMIPLSYLHIEFYCVNTLYFYIILCSLLLYLIPEFEYCENYYNKHWNKNVCVQSNCFFHTLSTTHIHISMFPLPLYPGLRCLQMKEGDLENRSVYSVPGELCLNALIQTSKVTS